MIGERIGDYEVDAEIGRGGSGVVYLAHDVENGGEVALRVLHAKLGGDARVLHRLDEVREALATVAHPHIVPMRAVLHHRRRTVIVNPYVHGLGLDQVLRNGPLLAAPVARVAAEAVGALRTAHAHGVLHGALGPSRIKCASRGIALVEIGLGEALLATRGHTIQRRHRSDPYRAPEVMRGAPASASADLFSLGATLLSALTGSDPGAEEVDPAEVLEEAGVDAPDWLVALLQGLLRWDPAERIADADAAAALIEAAGISVPGALERGAADEDPDPPRSSDPIDVNAVFALRPGAARPRLRSPRRTAPDTPTTAPVVTRRPRRRRPPPEGAPAQPVQVASGPEEHAVARGGRGGGFLGWLAGLGAAGVLGGLLLLAAICGSGAIWYTGQNTERTLAGTTVDGRLTIDNPLNEPITVICTAWAGRDAGEPTAPVTVPAGGNATVSVPVLPADCRATDPAGHEVLAWSAHQGTVDTAWQVSASASPVGTMAEEPDRTPADDAGDSGLTAAEGGTTPAASAGGSRSTRRSRRTTSAGNNSTGRRSTSAATAQDEVPPMADLTIEVKSDRRRFQSEVDIYVDGLRMGEMRVSTRVAVGQHNVRASRPDKGEVACVVYVPPEGSSFELDPASPRCP